MKNLILASAMVCLAGVALAQKLEVGGNFGIAKTFDANAEGGQLYYSAKGAYNVCSGFQVGLSGSITHLPFEEVMSTAEFSHGPTPPINFYAPSTQLIHSVKVFANVKRTTGNVTLYTGASAGGIKALKRNDFTAANSTLEGGYTVGVQAGATYNVTKRLGINAELGADYINMKANGGDYNRSVSKRNLSVINMPLTEGFRYKLSCPCAKSCPMGKKAN